MEISFPVSSQLLSAVQLLLRLWESGTREMDNERSTQGTSAPLLPLLQRFHNIHSSKEEPTAEEEVEVRPWWRPPLFPYPPCWLTFQLKNTPWFSDPHGPPESE